ncbi:MAG: putative oxidoreductase [Solirubrobacteraceae bacterium]|jgi:putative oxidoreductase|nr:putative oxidoreductase [Solirubrobacteraceae bacterium]
MKLGLTVLRVVVGGLFMGHGLQKLAGWFGGHGLHATGQSFESMGLRPGKVHAASAGASETAGGALIAAGLLTPLGASLLSGTMITAIRKVHARNGPWAAEGGYEYNLVLLAAVFAITDVGPGEWSLDEALGIRVSGLGWAIAQLAAGAIGSSLAVGLGERQPAPASPATSETDGGEGGGAAQQPVHNGGQAAQV